MYQNVRQPGTPWDPLDACAEEHAFSPALAQEEHIGSLFELACLKCVARSLISWQANVGCDVGLSYTRTHTHACSHAHAFAFARASAHTHTYTHKRVVVPILRLWDVYIYIYIYIYI